MIDDVRGFLDVFSRLCSNSAIFTIMELVKNIITSILKKINDPKLLATASQVSKAWRDAASQDTVWRGLYKAIYGPFDRNDLESGNKSEGRFGL
jgi:hypothetical protein